MARYGRRKPHQAIISRPLAFAAPASAPPVARPPMVISKVAVDTAARRRHTQRPKILSITPVVIDYTPPAVIVTWTFSHNLQDVDPRVRKTLGQMSEYFNNLLRTGQLGGTIPEPKLGYVADDTSSWFGNVSPDNIKEALDRIAAALTAIGHKP